MLSHIQTVGLDLELKVASIGPDALVYLSVKAVRTRASQGKKLFSRLEQIIRHELPLTELDKLKEEFPASWGSLDFLQRGLKDCFNFVFQETAFIEKGSFHILSFTIHRNLPVTP